MDSYYRPGSRLDGRCLYPFNWARVSFSGKVYFCPFIRVEVGDLTKQTLEEVWNGERLRRLRKKLLDAELFPVCRRCCKVELSPVPAMLEARRRCAEAARDPADRGPLTDDLMAEPASFSSTRRSSAASRSRGRAAARSAKRCSAPPSRPTRCALIAALLRETGVQRPAGGSHRRGALDAESLIGELDERRLRPDAGAVPVDDADAGGRRRGDGEAEGGVRRAARLLRPARLDGPVESMARAPEVDAMLVGEPEDTAVALATRLGPERSDRRARRRVASVRTDRSRRPWSRRVRRLQADAAAGVGPAAARQLSSADGQRGLHHRRDQPRLPVRVRLLRRADSPGPQVPRARAEGAGGRDRVGPARARRPLFLSVGRHGHAEPEDVRRVLRGADRAAAANPVVRQRARRQPDRSRVRPPAEASRAAGCSRWASSRRRPRSARTW